MKTLVCLVALLIGATAAQAQQLVVPMAGKPEEVGLSSERLKKIEAATQKNIDDGLIPGAVMLVGRRGKVAWTAAIGKQAPDAPEPMKMDTIFRIYSMTKPLVTTALMQMVEEGRLQVSDPVSKFIPELGNMKVATPATDLDGKVTLKLSDPTRPMTVQDLMRHTSGLTYGNRGSTPVHQAYTEAKIGDRTATVQEMVTRLSRLPLLFNPGDRWEYSVGVDVQGRLLEVLSGGKKLSEVLSERILQPLGMTDTAFLVPDAKLSRVAQPAPAIGRPSTPRFKVNDGAKYESGGGGLTSTIEDYLRFTSAIASGGTFQGKRIIGRKTLEFMTADQVGNRPGRPPGYGFGLGFEVRTREGEANMPGSVGEFGWSGAAGTYFWIDPKEQLFAIYMIQANDGDTRPLRYQFHSMVEAALID